MLTDPAIEVSGLRISCAMAAASLPTAAKRSCMRTSRSSRRISVKIVQCVNVAQHAALRNAQRGDQHAESLAKSVGAIKANFAMRRFTIHLRQRIQKKLVNWLLQQGRLRTLQQLLRRRVDQRDVSVQPGGDQAAADR